MSAAASPDIALGMGDLRDLDEIMLIMAEAFDPSLGEAWTRMQCEGMFRQDGVWANLARTDGKPAGFALTRLAADEAELLLLAVSPARRRSGIGRALLREAIVEAARRGARRLHLEVREDNSAVDLYRASDFEEVGRRPDYYRGAAGVRFNALTFARRIDASVAT